MSEEPPPSRSPTLEEAVRRLAEVEEEIETLTRLENLNRRVEAVEKRLAEVAGAAMKREEAEALYRALEAGLKEHAERRAAALEETAKEYVRRLSDIDAEIIEKMRRMERFFARVGDLETAMAKFRENFSIVVTQEMLAKERVSLEERILKAEVAKQSVDEMWDQMKSLRAALESFPRRGDLVDLRKSLRKEELADLRKEFDQRLDGQRRALDDSVKGLSQVDAEIIAKLKRLERSLERMSDQILSARKRAVVEARDEPGPGPGPGTAAG